MIAVMICGGSGGDDKKHALLEAGMFNPSGMFSSIAVDPTTAGTGAERLVYHGKHGGIVRVVAELLETSILGAILAYSSLPCGCRTASCRALWTALLKQLVSR